MPVLPKSAHEVGPPTTPPAQGIHEPAPVPASPKAGPSQVPPASPSK